jgi:uncharacterized protein (DUF697 family)
VKLRATAAAIRKLLKEVDASAAGEHVLAVGGANGLAPVLRQQFLRGRAAPGAVRLGAPEGADVYVHVLAGEPGEKDVAMVRRARRARVPVIAVAVGLADRDATIPYVLATDVVWLDAGAGFPLDSIARVIAARLGEQGAMLAGRVPLLREAVCEQLVSSLARRNGTLAAAVWVRGVDLPALTLNQFRLVLRLAQAYGSPGTRERVPELAATLGAGLGLRALARELLDHSPAAGWAVKGAVAYGGTRAVGEAARGRFAAIPTPRPAAASPGAP